MSDEPVLVDVADGVATVTLNRPEKKNAFNDAQWLGLRDVMRHAASDPGVAVMVLTGAGGNFSAGQDLSVFMGGDGDGDGAAAPTSVADTAFARFMDELVVFDKPLLAAATGVGVGIGATLLFHCDVVYVGSGVRLRLPFVSLGLVPEAASSYLLGAAIGRQRAAELFFTAEWIDADRAVETGIAVAAVDDADLLATVQAKAAEMAQWPVASLQATKRCLAVASRSGIEAARAIEDELMMERAGSPENIEAVLAFLDKRAPDFSQFRTS